MTVKRYQPWCAEIHGHTLSEDPNGLFVTYEDYEALKKKYEEILQEWLNTVKKISEVTEINES